MPAASFPATITKVSLDVSGSGYKVIDEVMSAKTSHVALRFTEILLGRIVSLSLQEGEETQMWLWIKNLEHIS